MWLEKNQGESNLPSLNPLGWSVAPAPAMPWARPLTANDRAPASPSPPLPPDTTAIIRKPGRTVMTSGKARAHDWVLSFQPCSAQFIEPLMGWCGGGDPLRHVELRFPTREAAERFAVRHGIPYEVDHAPPDRRVGVEQVGPPTVLWSDWMLDCLDPVRGGGLRWTAAEVERAILDPSRVFHDPQDVVFHPALTRTEKRCILTSWEWDALRIEATRDESWLDGEPSRLEEVRAALRALDAGSMPPAAANTNVVPAPEESAPDGARVA
ncbi:NADH dehydrogenase ubiquinone Fe-S protein 4 [Azospirillum rugosum]|uniref:ETC complex I subunit conserved region n=1 Tax=Azospirillum rugosum TaxID=416170 RepID=A0ABS4SP64_9PROT|nr:NADH dehydrogenase ubiquinone Fe-S protein 4 [Azospirillum rugosum]MBP2294351.1 hypothetical protein [Azospirillum rugosum]MDQ0527686.1 hypothetical protein [Azospirillum rugosum]